MPTHPVSSPNKPPQPRTHHGQIPNNVPNPPHQQTPTTPLSKLNSLSSQILKRTSRAWKSFQERSLANDQRYHLDTLLPTKKKRTSISQPPISSSPVPQHSPPRQSTPYPETDPIVSPILRQTSASAPSLRHASELLPLPSTTPDMSYAVRVMSYQPGHRSAVQSPYYLLVCVPIEHIVQYSTHRRPSPSTHRIILYSPYRPYHTTIPNSLIPGDIASEELWMDFNARGEESRLSPIHLFPFLS
ncbi:hypothetical protein GGI42DRAFT_213693 [Trichoderma sp. SZMC 28013]